MYRGFKVLFSVSAAFPVVDGRETVFNFRANLETAHFLGKLFRVLSQVLRIGDHSPSDDRDSSAANALPEKSAKTKKKVAKQRIKNGISSGGPRRNSFPPPAPPPPSPRPTLVADPLRRYHHHCRICHNAKNNKTHQIKTTNEPKQTLWKSSGELLSRLAENFIKGIPERTYGESRQILVRLSELIDFEHDRNPKWTCTVAMLLLSLNQRANAVK